MQRALLAALLVLPNTAIAGAWTQSDGGAFLKLGTRVVQADEFYDGDGNATDTGTLSDTVFSLYGEFGISKELTLVGTLPIRRLTVNRQVGELSEVVIFPGDSITALGDAEIGARYHLGRIGGTVFSFQGTLGVPIGVMDQQNGLVTGDGESDIRGELLVGHGFGSLPIYVTGGLGYAERFEGFSSEFRYGLELGWSGDWGVALLRANGIQSRKNGDDGVGAGADANLFANNASFLALGPEVTVKVFEGFGISAAAETVVFGENVFRAPAFTFGLTYSQ